MAAFNSIAAHDIGIDFVDPFSNVEALSGIAVCNVGQGDALCILDQDGAVVLRIDYGGKIDGPANGLSGQDRVDRIDKMLPVSPELTIMLTHWDEDHWYSAWKGTKAYSSARWIVPRQWPSIDAIELSANLDHIQCLPEAPFSAAMCFEARNGDRLWFEKLRPFNPGAFNEDCNLSGVMFSLVQAGTKKVIFMPGDAPLHRAKHYALLSKLDHEMRGLVAYHHGAKKHWTGPTTKFLQRWRKASVEQTIVFSYGPSNGYGHPVREKYRAAFPMAAYTKAALVDTKSVSAGESIKILF